jgi:hypothetical protein
MTAKPTIKDRTAAERQRRFRERRRHRDRRKLQRTAVTRPSREPAAQTVTTPTVAAVTPLRPPRHRGIIPLVMAGAALAVAAVSGSFSVIGLTAIFAGSFLPVIGMGAALEAAKLSAVAWLGRRYAAPRALKAGVTGLVVMLMGLNAIGCYGFLARAHIAHEVASEAQITEHQAQIDARKEVTASSVADISLSTPASSIASDANFSAARARSWTSALRRSA